MSRYDAIDCPICGKPLNNGDEIAVCPVCGAPYHRSCYREEGRCIFPELHEREESWQPPKKEEPYTSSSGPVCSRCGTTNPPHGLFCQVCGNQLNNPNAENSQSGDPDNPWERKQGNPNQNFPFGRSPFGRTDEQLPPEMPLNPYTTPFGGVAPDEVIDGVPAKDLAIFVSRNSHYFLPHFKQISKTKMKVINWSAFLFMGGYFLYRKMYLWGVLALFANVIIGIPPAMILMQQITSGTMMAGGATSSVSSVNMVCNFLSLALHILCGMFANTLYFSHCKKKITAEKAVPRSESEYYAVLSKKGSVATKLVTGLLIGYVALNFLSMAMLMTMMGL